MVRCGVVAGVVLAGFIFAVPANGRTIERHAGAVRTASGGRAAAEILIDDGVARMVSRAASPKRTRDLAPRELLGLYLLASLKGAGAR